jgi:hypothetical protein
MARYATATPSRAASGLIGCRSRRRIWQAVGLAPRADDEDMPQAQVRRA